MKRKKLKCKDYQDLMYLYRPGELSDYEIKMLSDHISACSSCRIEYSGIMNSADQIRRLRVAEPLAKDPDTLTNFIMNNIENNLPASEKIHKKHYLQIITNIFYSNFIRVPAVSCLAVLMFSFFFLTLADQYKLSSLEKKTLIYSLRNDHTDIKTDSSLMMQFSHMLEYTSANDSASVKINLTNKQELISWALPYFRHFINFPGLDLISEDRYLPGNFKENLYRKILSDSRLSLLHKIINLHHGSNDYVKQN